MKLTKKQLKILIQEEMAKELKGDLLQLNEDTAQVEGARLGLKLWHAYDYMGIGGTTDDSAAKEVYDALKNLAAAGRNDAIQSAIKSFNQKAKEVGEEDIYYQTKDEDPDDIAEDLVALLRKAEMEASQPSKEDRDAEVKAAVDAALKKAGAGKYSPEAIARAAQEKAQDYLKQFNLTPEILNAVAMISKRLGVDKMSAGLQAVVQNLPK